MERKYEIVNSDLNDLPKIFELYEFARKLMRSKNQVVWPQFVEQLIVQEIKEARQWKLEIEGKVACVWATTQDDELIWGEANADAAVYIHRIATHPDFRGQRLVDKIIKWADSYCDGHNLNFVRLDTVGLNRGLIGHYTKLGFQFLGTRELENTKDLPHHYSLGPVCLFQRSPKDPRLMNYNGRRFRPIQNSENGETSDDTIFEYKQTGNILTSEYKGGKILEGHLIGLVDKNGHIEMRYHQVNNDGELRTGICFSKPEFLEDGKIRLLESWEWTSGDRSKGTSVLEEI